MFRKVYLGYPPVWIKREGSNGFLEFTGGRTTSYISIPFFIIFFFTSSLPFPILFILIIASGTSFAPPLRDQRCLDKVEARCFKFTCFVIEYY